jgi:SPP1 gp7 family putative phage head morphogenesis protein
MITKDRVRDTQKSRRTFAYVRKAEFNFATRLRALARQIGEIVNGFDEDDPNFSAQVTKTLNSYAGIITPWARVTARRVILEIARRDESVWRSITEQMGRSLNREIQTAPTGAVLQGFLNEQVTLITSLPREAASRVHELTLKGITEGRRAAEISKEIMRTGEVTKARANLIARTEVGRTASGLVMARAMHIGSEGYIWRSAEDSDVRNTDGNPVGSHRLLNGKFIRWDEPPVASTNGVRAHAGMIYNCRCYPEVVIPDTM